MKNKKSIIILIVVVMICGGLYLFKMNKLDEAIVIKSEDIIVTPENMEDELVTNNEVITEINNNEVITETNNNEPMEYKVYICGAVNNSKVVTIKEGARLIDVLELAGGATEEADLNNINLSAFVEEAQKIYIPKIGEKVDKNEFTAQNSNSIDEDNTNSANALININKADKIQLQALPNIGESIAQYIIDYRTQNGDFKNIDEIKNVNRIGEKTFNKIKDLITIK